MNMKKTILGILIGLSIATQGASFNVSHPKTMAFEGGRVFTSNYGELSKHGITKETLLKYNKKYKTSWGIKSLTRNQADAIYLKEWWNVLRLEEVEGQVIANNVYDMAVNSGHPRASKTLQQVLADLTWLHNKNNPEMRLTQVKVDGVIGTETIARLNYFTQQGKENDIVRRYKMKRLAFVKSLNVIKDKNGKTKWETFQDNWTRRINGI